MRCQTNDSGNRGGASGMGEEPSRYIVAQIAQQSSLWLGWGSVGSGWERSAADKVGDAPPGPKISSGWRWANDSMNCSASANSANAPPYFRFALAQCIACTYASEAQAELRSITPRHKVGLRDGRGPLSPRNASGYRCRQSPMPATAGRWEQWCSLIGFSPPKVPDSHAVM